MCISMYNMTRIWPKVSGHECTTYIFNIHVYSRSVHVTIYIYISICTYVIGNWFVDFLMAKEKNSSQLLCPRSTDANPWGKRTFKYKKIYKGDTFCACFFRRNFCFVIWFNISQRVVMINAYFKRHDVTIWSVSLLKVSILHFEYKIIWQGFSCLGSCVSLAANTTFGLVCL